MNEELKETVKTYVEQLRTVKYQVGIWNERNDYRLHGQMVLLGAVAKFLEEYFLREEK